MGSLTSGARTGWRQRRPAQPGPHWTGKKTGPSNDEPAVWRRSLLSHGGPRQTGFAVCPEEQQLHEQLHSAQQQQQPQLHSVQAGQPGQQSELLAALIWHCILKPIRSMMALPFSGRSGMASDSNTRPDRRAPSLDGLPRRFRGVQTKPGKTSWIPILNLTCGHITGGLVGGFAPPCINAPSLYSRPILLRAAESHQVRVSGTSSAGLSNIRHERASSNRSDKTRQNQNSDDL